MPWPKQKSIVIHILTVTVDAGAVKPFFVFCLNSVLLSLCIISLV